MEKQSQAKGIIRSLGLVFGDIGTSPIYTVTVVFLLLKPTHDNVIGVLSLIVWTLLTLVTVQYAWLAMSLSRRGEGGSIVLKEILTSLLSSKKKCRHCPYNFNRRDFSSYRRRCNHACHQHTERSGRFPFNTRT